MGGFFGVASKQDCVLELFYGVDYHSHLGTRRGGMAVYGEDGFYRAIHNIENSSFGASNCAERTAIFKAVSEGHSDFDRIAVVSSSGEKTYPCGICRQVMSEFFHGDERIITEDKDGIYSYDINALLPYAFKL